MINSDEIFIDKSSYETVWDVLIFPTIKDYQKRFANVTVSDNAQETIWNEYVFFNTHCKTAYMQDKTGKLDRHKVCAAYIYSITKAKVMGCTLASLDIELKYLTLNENLAITVLTEEEVEELRKQGRI